MSNILDYLDWRGDLSFSSSPFNSVDNLIFSKLIYADFSFVVPDSFSQCVTLKDAFARFTALGRGATGRAGDPYPLLEKAARSVRFSEIRLCGYERLYDETRMIQFAAVTFLFEGGAYIAFEGTDDSLVGWREDAELSFMEVTGGQRASADYAARAAKALDGPFYLGGHSKGGNLAVYSAAFALEEARVIRVFSNDGPGMNDALGKSPEYLRLIPKIEKNIPESSVVGILLPDGSPVTVVKSDGKGIGQHNVYTWQVLGTAFEKADGQSAGSLFANETVRRWMASMEPERRAIALNTVFDALECAGCTTFRELSENKRESYNAILKAVIKTDPASRKQVFAALKNAAKSGGEVIWDSAKKSFEKNTAVQKLKKKLPRKKKG